MPELQFDSPAAFRRAGPRVESGSRTRPGEIVVDMDLAVLVFFAVLFVVFALGVALGASLAQMWQESPRRMRENELLRWEREQALKALEAHLANHPD